MLPDNFKRFVVYFDKKDLDKIDKLAKTESRSRVNFIVHAVKEYAKKEHKVTLS